jgi:hydroxymethylpyrimidine/phosphomethylpyrimidine kinase
MASVYSSAPTKKNLNWSRHCSFYIALKFFIIEIGYNHLFSYLCILDKINTLEMDTLKKNIPIIMTIAGSDSGAGAGIQADLKTISALGGYGTSVITAITAQNTCGVCGIHPIPTVMIEQQFSALISDFDIKAIKTGMLQGIDVIDTVAKCIAESGIKNFVLDPVMVATSGDKLVFEDTVSALISKLIPLAKVITPNLYEAEILLNRKINTFDEMQKAALDLLDFNLFAVLLKGGHLPFNSEYNQQKIFDILVTVEQTSPIIFANDRIITNNTHGTGCTLSAAIATFLAKGQNLETAIKNSEDYIHKAILTGAKLKLGKGNGPLWHFV